MSAGVEDRSSRDAHSGAGLSPAHPRHHAVRAPHRIPTSPVTAAPAEPEPVDAGAIPESVAPDTSTSGGSATSGEPGGSEKHHHHVLIEPDEDRWAWRRRIRQNPHQLRIYRVGIGFAGLLLICLGLVTGPLPGPGGIPLVLLGLAVWSSEFEWAYRLRQRFKAEIKKFRGWPTGKKVAFWIIFFAVCAGFGYAYLVVLGPPFWMPDVGANLLEHLPGVEAG
jgi:uncharacterized protein (TIGR02611 family)